VKDKDGTTAERFIGPPGTTGLCFTRDVFFISPHFLRGPAADRRETLPHDQKLA